MIASKYARRHNKNTALSEPLLGPEANNAEVLSCVEVDLEAQKVTTKEPTDEEETALGSTLDILSSSVILYVLLLVQFALPYCSQYNDSVTRSFLPSLRITIPSISLFAVATVLYKSSLECSGSAGPNQQTQHWIIYLLPEVWMNVVLFVILWTENVTAALQLVLMGNLVLATWGLVRSVMSTCSATNSSGGPDEELDVSLYRGKERTIEEKAVEEPVVVAPVISCCGCVVRTM